MRVQRSPPGRQPGPHDGGGDTTAFPFFAHVSDSRMTGGRRPSVQIEPTRPSSLGGSLPTAQRRLVEASGSRHGPS